MIATAAVTLERWPHSPSYRRRRRRRRRPSLPAFPDRFSGARGGDPAVPRLLHGVGVGVGSANIAASIPLRRALLPSPSPPPLPFPPLPLPFPSFLSLLLLLPPSRFALSRLFFWRRRLWVWCRVCGSSVGVGVRGPCSPAASASASASGGHGHLRSYSVCPALT